jgi:poly(A) polymerase Pap1
MQAEPQQLANSLEAVVRELQPQDECLQAIKDKRTEALHKLALVLKMWARMVVYQSGQPDKVVSQKHLKLLPYGSFKYDDAFEDSDIDLLCITSRYVTRKNFFYDLRRLFEGMKGVEGFTVITAACVPLIKMRFHGVAMDMCFTQLDVPCVPRLFNLEYIEHMNIFALDDKSMTSMNGFIMTSKIAQLVPDFKTFTTTLNTVKLWAKRRQVYSALLGFLSGSSLSVMVGKLCQLNPKATSAELVSIFFQYYSTWDWALQLALDDTAENRVKMTQQGQLLSKQQPWIPPTDCSRDVMRVMTPLHPSTNTARNVSRSSLTVLRAELRRAAWMTRDERRGAADWHAVFEDAEDSFFHKYPAYIQITVGTADDDATSSDEEEKGLKGGLKGEGKKSTRGEGARKWEGWVKSRVPALIKSLEQHEGIMYAHASMQTFTRHSTQSYELDTTIGLATDPATHPSPPLPTASTTQFARFVSGWREFDATRMGVRVDFVARSAVPDFVFNT